MVSELCNQKLFVLIKLATLRGGFLTFLCVTNLVFSVVAVLGNTFIICALRKASSIPTTLRTLFLSLAVSDLAVGLTVQPIFSVQIAIILNTEDPGFLCNAILMIPMFLSYLLTMASFLSIAAIAFDRFLALSLHLRYQALVPPTRVLIFLVILWTVSGGAASMFIFLPSHNNLVIIPIAAIGILPSAIAYFRINRIAGHHRKQIQKQKQIQIDFERARKSAFNTVYVYFVFLACYLPLLCSMAVKAALGNHISLLVFRYFAMTIVFFNSSLNPFIYGWRYREVREIVRATFKDVFKIISR